MMPNERDEAFDIFWKASKLKWSPVRRGVAFDIFRAGILFAEARAKFGLGKALELLKESCE